MTGQFVPKGQESRRHRKEVVWTEEDSVVALEHMKSIAAGKCKCVEITSLDANEILNAPDNAFFCANCECYDQADGDRKNCDCPCHMPGGCNY